MPSLQDTLFPDPVNLTLRTTTRGATIYLTTDGTDPRIVNTQSIFPFVTDDHPVEAHVPTRESNVEIGTTWRQVEDPSNIDDWVTGPNGVGYEQFPNSNPSYDPFIQTELTEMYNDQKLSWMIERTGDGLRNRYIRLERDARLEHGTSVMSDHSMAVPSPNVVTAAL